MRPMYIGRHAPHAAAPTGRPPSVTADPSPALAPRGARRPAASRIQRGARVAGPTRSVGGAEGSVGSALRRGAGKGRPIRPGAPPPTVRRGPRGAAPHRGWLYGSAGPGSRVHDRTAGKARPPHPAILARGPVWSSTCHTPRTSRSSQSRGSAPWASICSSGSARSITSRSRSGSSPPPSARASGRSPRAARRPSCTASSRPGRARRRISRHAARGPARPASLRCLPRPGRARSVAGRPARCGDRALADAVDRPRARVLGRDRRRGAVR